MHHPFFVFVEHIICWIEIGFDLIPWDVRNMLLNLVRLERFCVSFENWIELYPSLLS
jgi:hypothetical protein